MTAVYTSQAVSLRLLLGWCAWLIVSWLLHLFLEAPGRMWVMLPDGALVWRVPSDALGNVVLGLLQSMILGVVTVWPLWRLSTQSLEPPGAETFNDAVVIWVVAQVVVLPMRLLVDMSVERLLWADGVLLLAAASAAIIVWIGRRSVSVWGRTIAMVGCVGLLFVPWIAGYVTGYRQAAGFSFFQMMDVVCRGEAPIGPALTPYAAIWAGVIALAWALGLLKSPREAGAA